MIGMNKHIDSGARMARMMYDAGAQGLSKENALQLALEQVPVIAPPRVKKALTHFFRQ